VDARRPTVATWRAADAAPLADAGWSAAGAASPQADAASPAGGPAPPEADPVERARSLAWRALDRRDRTVAELGGMLLAKRVEPAVADEVVTELIELGYLDDARYAERFAEDRRRLDGWGAERIGRRLRELGVERDHVDAALAAQDPEAELEAAIELLRRRCPTPPATRPERDRALGILLRRGYAPELALDALRRHAGAEEPEWS
jgi:regulatory protein